LFQSLGQLSFTLAQAANAHRNRKDLVDHRQRLALAGVDIPCKNTDNRQDTRTKILTLDVIRQRTIDKGSTVSASEYILDVFHDFGLYGRDIHNLMTQRLLTSLLDMVTAARTSVGLKMNMLFDKLLRQKSSQMRRMAISCSAFLTSPRQNHNRSRRIRRGRFGRILRIHPQSPFQFFKTFFQKTEYGSATQRFPFPVALYMRPCP
jgi:hypothetical protein